MKVAICDDIPSSAHQTEELLLEYRNRLLDVDVFYSPKSLLTACQTDYYDFYILDIEMPEMTGVQLAESIRNIGHQNPIVFLTSYKQYMEEVFKLHTFDYLIKPVSKSNMYLLLDRLLKYLNVEEKRFIFNFNRVSHSILLSEISYFEKSKRTVFVHTEKEKFEVLMTTEELLTHLNDSFVRVHNSFIVNIRFIKKIRNNSVTLFNDTQIPMSRKFSKDAKELIMMKTRELM